MFPHGSTACGGRGSMVVPGSYHFTRKVHPSTLRRLRASWGRDPLSYDASHRRLPASPHYSEPLHALLPSAPFAGAPHAYHYARPRACLLTVPPPPLAQAASHSYASYPTTPCCYISYRSTYPPTSHVPRHPHSDCLLHPIRPDPHPHRIASNHPADYAPRRRFKST